MFAKLTSTQANFLKLIRTSSDSDRKELKRELFSVVKAKFGIPDEHKLKVEIDDVDSPRYLVLVRKSDDSAYVLGSDDRWAGALSDMPAITEFRWFPVDAETLAHAAAGLVEDVSWDDGISSPPEGAHIQAALGDYGHAVAFTSDGQLYVEMAIDEFDVSI